MKKILLVDDDSLVLATLTMGLQRAGYSVSQVDNGEAAIKLEQNERFDLAILDMRMPKMSGLEVAAVFRAAARTPFIFLSAFNEDDVVKTAAYAGALGYLVKPIEISRILPAIEIAIVRHDELAKLEQASLNLTEALNSNRETDIAIGLLMGRHQMDRASAFNLLRNAARNQRCKITKVAQQLIAGEILEL
jgi:response regulator NasT